MKPTLVLSIHCTEPNTYSMCGLIERTKYMNKLGKNKSKIKDWILNLELGFRNFPRAQNMCKMFSLVTSKKKCLLFNFWMIKFTIIPKKAIWHLKNWQNWCFGQFIIQKLKSKHFFLWWQIFWGNERKYFTHTL